MFSLSSTVEEGPICMASIGVKFQVPSNRPFGSDYGLGSPITAALLILNLDLIAIRVGNVGAARKEFPRRSSLPTARSTSSTAASMSAGETSRKPKCGIPRDSPAPDECC
jgi:hypothetical protein